MADKNWPAWYSGPHGETAIFQSAGDVPPGWTTGAEKAPAPGSKAPAALLPQAAAVSPDKPVDVDAAGWPFDPALHAATATRTKDDLWRMKVGVARPDPKPGYPRPVLDL